MLNKSGHIHPIFDQLLPREDKEKLLNQRAKVIWFTGLSGSGKSTIAKGVELVLHQKGFLTMVLDGDNIRAGINNNLGFTNEDRTENIRRIAEVAKLFAGCGIVTICSFVSPTNAIREMAKSIIGADDFLEVYVNTPLEECERRDVKGLYAKARTGEVKDFTGISAPFEAPAKPALEVKTEKKSVEESVNEVVSFVLPQIKMKL
ncbi:MAG TPA: adenylyl-sulfate kinase [Chitinophagales bacterium]|nr:adenylyl-sulfate kinase [Chitinophagales bacterium]